MDTYTQTRGRLKIGLAAGGLPLMLAAIPAGADTVVGLGPNSSGSVLIVFNGTGNPIHVMLPAALSGTGYEFDSGGTSTIFSPGATDLTPFSSSNQGTTLSLNGGSPTPVSWVDIGGGGLPGIVVLQFTTPLQSPGTYDDLILNINSATAPFLAAAVAPGPTGGGSPAVPNLNNSNICAPSITCSYDSLVGGSGTIVTSYVLCGFLDLSVCVGGTAPNPITLTAGISSGEVFVGTPPIATPEPSTLSLLAASLISMLGLGVIRLKVFPA